MPESMSSCYHCGAYFGPQSDIAVCSACGRPHHRSCWSMTGRCSTPDCPGTPVDNAAREPAPDRPAELTETRKCPFCAETIQAGAIKCRYCQTMLYQAIQSAPSYVASNYPHAPYVERYVERRYPEPPSDGLMTFLYIITLCFPIIGIVVGAIFSGREDYETARKGKSLLTFSLVTVALACVCVVIIALIDQ